MNAQKATVPERPAMSTRRDTLLVRVSLGTVMLLLGAACILGGIRQVLAPSFTLTSRETVGFLFFQASSSLAEQWTGWPARFHSVGLVSLGCMFGVWALASFRGAQTGSRGWNRMDTMLSVASIAFMLTAAIAMQSLGLASLLTLPFLINGSLIVRRHARRTTSERHSAPGRETTD